MLERICGRRAPTPKSLDEYVVAAADFCNNAAKDKQDLQHIERSLEELGRKFLRPIDPEVYRVDSTVRGSAERCETDGQQRDDDAVDEGSKVNFDDQPGEENAEYHSRTFTKPGGVATPTAEGSNDDEDDKIDDRPEQDADVCLAQHKSDKDKHPKGTQFFN